ncbi:uncharacterized protein [Parasteatoda tepidariorum]|uniref:uncharacterized protein n=1 Tax=Parasteatoda tepidariorum TaxID=114398 RepID=UPI00077FC658
MKFGIFLFLVFPINCILSESLKENELSDAKIESKRNLKIPDPIQIYSEIIPHFPTRVYLKSEKTTYYTDLSTDNHITTSILQSFDPRQTLLTSTPSSLNPVPSDKQKILPSTSVADVIFSFPSTQKDSNEDELNVTKHESYSDEDLSTAETEIVVSIQPMPSSNPLNLQQSYAQTVQPIKNISIGQTLSQAMSATNKPTIQDKGNIALTQHVTRRGGAENPQSATSAVATPIPVTQTVAVAKPVPHVKFVHPAPTHEVAVPSFQITFDPVKLILGLLQGIPIPSLNLNGKAFFGVQLDKGLNFGPGAGAAATSPVLQQVYAQRRQQPRLSSILRLG